jgi:probable F420-dependent oxidoreductase
MKIGVTLRNMGPQSSADVITQCATLAEQAGVESIWITDHIAIPPDDAEGSGGRYTDPLTTLAYLAGVTRSINLGVGVLILPYRPALPTAKQIATVQELSGGRLLVGAGVGWMDAEFKALGIDRHQRGKITDDTLALFARCFANDIVTQNDQPLIFSPRPTAPPIYIGGAAPHALKRALRFGHGWMPMARDPDKLKANLEQYREMAAARATSPGPVTVLGGVAVGQPKAAEQIERWKALGIERLVCALRYNTVDDYARALDALASVLP